jgi:L-aminopeptidase/D-esterase-like protein
MAHDGLARTLNPVHTPWDGDTVFALATGAIEAAGGTLLVGALAAEAMARAIVRGVRAAVGAAGLPAARDLVRS